MGINGLSQFVKSHPSLTEATRWKLNSVNIKDRFIFDGNAFVYSCAYEYRTHWIYGGQYATIACVIVQIINKLKNAGIEPIFLFDGALPADKIETRTKRHRSYIQRCALVMSHLEAINTLNRDLEHLSKLFLIPPLTFEVILQTLRDLQVYVRICDAEADGEVAKMAEKEDGYIVSQDSDMYIYPNTGKGYIPLNTLKIPIDDGNSKHISASVFYPDRLAQLLRLDRQSLPLLGTLMGNDYLDGELCRYAIVEWCNKEGIQVGKNQTSWPRIVSEFINRNSEGDVIKNVLKALMPAIHRRYAKQIKMTELESLILNSIRQYSPDSPFLISQKSKEVGNLFVDQNSQSRLVMEIIKNQTFWSSIFLEDVERESSWLVSQTLRQEIYEQIRIKINLEEYQVTEYIRKKQHLEAIQLSVRKRNVETDAWSWFLLVHKINKVDMKPFEKNGGLCYLILCLRYMIHYYSREENNQLTNHEVIAIILSTLHSLSPCLESNQVPVIEAVALKKRSVHLAAQFQNVLYSSHLLSQILDIEIHAPLAHMYDGLAFHYYLEKTRNGASIRSLLPKESLQLFLNVYKVIINDLNNKILDIFDYNIQDTITNDKPKRINKQKNTSLRPGKKSKQIISSNNVFDLLDAA